MPTTTTPPIDPCVNSQVAEAFATSGLSEYLDAVKDKAKEEAAASGVEVPLMDDAPDQPGQGLGQGQSPPALVEGDEPDPATSHMVIIVAPAQALSEDSTVKLQRFQQHAKRLVATYVKLETEPKSEQQLVAMIQSSLPGYGLLVLLVCLQIPKHAL